MRVFIAIITATLGLLAGLFQASGLKARKESLAEIVLMLEEAAIHIRYNALPIDELIMRLERFEFIKSVLSNLELQNDRNWRKAWEKAARDTFGLNADDKNLLVSVGNSLGSSDITGQLAMLRLNKNFFSARLSEVTADFGKKTKMYRSVGLLAGLGMAIMII